MSVGRLLCFIVAVTPARSCIIREEFSREPPSDM